MKSIIIALVVAAALAASALIYPECMEVVDIDRAADLVTLETSAGHLYQMTGAEDWQRGDLAALLMWSNGTPDDVTDDAILTARASGFFWG